MPKYRFFTQAAKDSSNPGMTGEELLNCYAEQGAGDALGGYAVRSVLGETLFCETGEVLVRAAEAVPNKIGAVIGGDYLEIASDGSFANRGAVGDSEETGISTNLGVVTIVADGKYYVWDGTTLTEPTAGAFEDFGSVTFMDYDTILTELDGKKFQWSDTADAETLDALNFASAEARDGNIIRGMVDRTQLYLFCDKHIEVWYNTGVTGPSRYARLNVIDRGRGLKAYHLARQTPFGLFFIGNDDVAYMMSGTDSAEVSTPSVNTDLRYGQVEACN